MTKFSFHLPSEDQIRNSVNGRIMLSIINNDFPKHNILVTGCPGSGKTTVSIMRLKRLLQEGKDAFLITYQRMLKLAIQNMLLESNTPKASSKVHTLYSWYSKVANEWLKYPSDQYPQTSSEIRETLRRIGFEDTEIILDEGQDLEERIFQSFPDVFKKMMIGADNDQQLYPHQGSNEETILKYIPPYHRFPLQFNYRNTYPIYNFARHFLPESPKAKDTQMLDALQRENNGDIPEVLKFDNQHDMIIRLDTILRNYQGANVGVLLIKTERVNHYYQQISELGFECSYYYSEMSKEDRIKTERNLKSILVTTYNSAKGMEFDLVIMPDFENAYNNESSRKKYYVGCTRAKNRLVLMYVSFDLPYVLQNFPKETYTDGSLFGNFTTSQKQDNNSEDDLPF